MTRRRRLAGWSAGPALRLALDLALALALGGSIGAAAQTRTLVAYAGSYSADTVYSVNDMVSMGGDFYVSLARNNKGNIPGASAAAWAPLGAVGATGAQGSAGATGPQGPAGPVGQAGPQGVAGVPGPARPAGPQGSTGAIGAAGPQGAAGTAGIVAETRTLSVAHIKGGNIMAGSSLTLFSATGPGNVERIQIAAGYNSGSPAQAPIAANTLITIAVDGKSYSCSLGMFLLWNGYTTSDGVAATSNLFATKYLGITSATSQSNETISGYRRIYIRYNSSISISIAVPAAAGAGELESIYFVSSAPGKVEPQWLEQNPHIAVDGTDFWYGGTEDFFGNQFYGDQWQGRADEYGIARDYQSAAPDNTTYWSGYRYFRESAMVFNNSIGMTWQNAGAGAGPAAQLGTLAVYYTTQ